MNTITAFQTEAAPHSSSKEEIIAFSTYEAAKKDSISFNIPTIISSWNLFKQDDQSTEQSDEAILSRWVDYHMAHPVNESMLSDCNLSKWIALFYSYQKNRIYMLSNQQEILQNNNEIANQKNASNNHNFWDQETQKESASLSWIKQQENTYNNQQQQAAALSQQINQQLWNFQLPQLKDNNANTSISDATRNKSNPVTKSENNDANISLESYELPTPSRAYTQQNTNNVIDDPLINNLLAAMDLHCSTNNQQDQYPQYPNAVQHSENWQSELALFDGHCQDPWDDTPKKDEKDNQQPQRQNIMNHQYLVSNFSDDENECLVIKSEEESYVHPSKNHVPLSVEKNTLNSQSQENCYNSNTDILQFNASSSIQNDAYHLNPEEYKQLIGEEEDHITVSIKTILPNQIQDHNNLTIQEMQDLNENDEIEQDDTLKTEGVRYVNEKWSEMPIVDEERQRERRAFIHMLYGLFRVIQEKNKIKLSLSAPENASQQLEDFSLSDAESIEDEEHIQRTLIFQEFNKIFQPQFEKYYTEMQILDDPQERMKTSLQDAANFTFDSLKGAPPLSFRNHPFQDNIQKILQKTQDFYQSYADAIWHQMPSFMKTASH